MTSDDVGQGRAVANTLMGMGGLAVAAAVVATLLELELKFIDGAGLASFGALMVATGLFQHWLVRKSAVDSHPV